jgi:crotonobetainyl-CoA:carnitine CoA-transferase CaiB-like acyl-CoA transferase
MFNALNRSKQRLDLDLRESEARHELCMRAATATVIVDAFSPRVMPNLGLTRATLAAGNRELLSVSMPAFPVGHPRREHVSYGTGIHAELGLGEQRDGSFQAPSATYPDAIGGLTAFATIVALIVGRDRGWRASHVEVPLLAASAPLLSFAGAPADLAGDDMMGHRLLHDPRLCRGAWFEELTDGAGTHRYPRAPFAGAVASTPAPALPAPGRE